MVIYTDTFEPCHPLSEQGKEEYQEILSKKADEILWKARHPILGFIYNLLGIEIPPNEGE